MRVTGPTVRRRNHAWLQMRSRERRATRLAQRQQNGAESSDDADTSGNESAFSIDSSDDESDAEPTKTLRVPLPSATAGVRTGRGVRLLPSPVPDVATGVTLGADAEEIESASDGIESASDGIDSDGEESADESTAPPANATPPPGAAPPPPPPAITSTATTSTIAASPPPVTSLASPVLAAPLAPSSASSSSSSSSTSSSSRTRTPPQAVLSTIVPAPGPSGSSSSLDELVTSLTRSSQQTGSASTTIASSVSVPITGSTQTEEAQVVPPGREANEREGEGLGVGTASRNNLSTGAVAGILIGVLGMSLITNVPSQTALT